MTDKRFYISFITASRQIRIVDRETCIVAVVDVYDDTIHYFVDKLNEQETEIERLNKLLLNALSYVPIETRVKLLGTLKRSDKG